MRLDPGDPQLGDSALRFDKVTKRYDDGAEVKTAGTDGRGEV